MKFSAYSSDRSAAKLSYDDAQALLSAAEKIEFPHGPDVDIESIRKDISVLHDLAKHLRERRYANGVLDVSSERLSFDLDASGKPTDCGFNQREDSSRLVEEVRFDYYS